MNKEQAYQIILQVVEQFRATPAEHRAIQEALKVLREDKKEEKK